MESLPDKKLVIQLKNPIFSLFSQIATSSNCPCGVLRKQNLIQIFPHRGFTRECNFRGRSWVLIESEWRTQSTLHKVTIQHCTELEENGPGLDSTHWPVFEYGALHIKDIPLGNTVVFSHGIPRGGWEQRSVNRKYRMNYPFQLQKLDGWFSWCALNLYITLLLNFSVKKCKNP